MDTNNNILIPSILAALPGIFAFIIGVISLITQAKREHKESTRLEQQTAVDTAEKAQKMALQMIQPLKAENEELRKEIESVRKEAQKNCEKLEEEVQELRDYLIEVLTNSRKLHDQLVDAGISPEWIPPLTSEIPTVHIKERKK